MNCVKVEMNNDDLGPKSNLNAEITNPIQLSLTENEEQFKSASQIVKLEMVLQENQSTLPKVDNTAQVVYDKPKTTLLNDIKVIKDETIPTSSKTVDIGIKPVSEISPMTSTLEDFSVSSKIYVCCRFCKKGFQTMKIFRNHNCRKSKNNPKVNMLKCKFCSLTFSQKIPFQNHLQCHERNNCTLCNAQFTKRKALCKHLRTAHDVKEPLNLYQCSFCDKRFLKRLSLNLHLKSHSNNRYFCLRCCFKCDDEDTYNDHIKQHIKNSKHECNLCQKKFVRRQQYDQHMTAHERYFCSSCNLTFSSKKPFTRHQHLIHGAAEEKKYACLICEKLFARQKFLDIHQRVHTGEKPVKCSHCEENFCDSQALLKHMKTVKHLQRVSHQKGQTVKIEKSFLCSKCGMRFYHHQSLLRHVKIIHSTTEFLKCSFCDYKSKNKTNLKRHLDLHTDVKRFVCEKCGSSFHALATLKQHYVFVHSENREFTCDTCKKSFKNKSDLSRHARVHSENRPYKCYCDKAYKRMSHLKRHMVSAHQVTLKKNQIPMNMKENSNLDSPLSDDSVTALIKSLETLPDESSSCDDFPVSHYITTIPTNCATTLDDLNINGESGEEQLPAESKDVSSFDVPLNIIQVHPNNCDEYVITRHLENATNTFHLNQDLTTNQLPPAHILESAETSAASFDDNTLSLSPSNYCNNSSPISKIPLDNVSLDVPLLRFINNIDNIRPQSMPNLNFTTPASNIDSLISLPLNSINSTISPPISPFLPSGDISSPSHVTDLSLEQNSAQRQLFKDFFSLPPYAESNEFEAFNWDTDTDENSNSLKVSSNDLAASSTCANIFSSSLTSNANNLMPNNLFANDLLDATTLNSDFDSFSNFCLI